MGVLEPPSWTPEVGDVATHLYSRTRMTNGDYSGTFNSQTFPTDVMVEAIIVQQVSMLRPKLGDVPDRMADAAQALLALKAACEVEKSCFPEEVENGSSAHGKLFAAYGDALEIYIEAAEGDTPNGDRTASLPCGTLYPGYATGTF